MIDYDPRLVALYDGDNPDGPDHDFYRALANDASAESIVDLGCGTGILTVSFAREGRRVLGVDPSATMLAYARRRVGADAVSWILGDSRSIPASGFDLAVMSGNVAQHVPKEDWERTLHDLRQRLKSGATLTFESRNPASRAWEGWKAGGRSMRDTPHGMLVEWMDVVESASGVVELVAHNLFAETNETVIETQRLVFRDQGTLERQLEAAGFDVAAVYGDWQRTPFTEDAPLIVCVARAR